MADQTPAQLAATAVEWSCVSAGGFSVAIVLAYVLLRIRQWYTEDKRPSRTPGNFGKFMVMLEMVDAVPEAAVIADTVVSGQIQWSFVVAIFFLNMANTLSSSIDFMATRPERALHKLLLSLVLFAVGMLSYTISVTLHADVKLYFDEDAHTATGLVLTLIAGGVVGAFIVILLIRIEHRLESIGNSAEDRRMKRRDADNLHELLSGMRSYIEMHQTVVREGRWVDTVREEVRGSGRTAEAMDTEDESEDAAHDPAVGEPVEEGQTVGYAQDVVEEYEQRLEKLCKVCDSLEAAQMLVSSLDDAPIAHDVGEIVNEIVAPHRRELERQYLLVHDAAPAAYGALGDGDEAGLVAPRDGAGGGCCRLSPLSRRALKLLCMMTAIGVWTLLLTYLFAYLFVFLKGRPASGYANAFAEGLSSGAFLATVAGTMMPRVQQDAYRSMWGKVSYRVVGLLAFESGMLTGVLIDLIAASQGELEPGLQMPPMKEIL